MKIIVWPVIAFIILTVVFYSFGIASVGDGFHEVLKKIPFVDTYTDVVNHLFGLQASSGLKTPASILNDLLKTLILACIMPIILGVLKFFGTHTNLKGAALESLVDSLAYKVKLVMLDVIGLIIGVLFVSSALSAMQVFLFNKIGSFLTYVIQIVLSIGLFAAGALVLQYIASISLFMAFGYALINHLIKNLFKIVFMLLLYVLTYYAFTQGFIVAIFPAFIVMLGILWMVDAMCGMFTKKWVRIDRYSRK